MWNHFWKTIGAIALPLNAIRHRILGYTRPRDFPPADIAKAIAYDWEVVGRWRATLGAGVDLSGKTVLELGPGPDLGVGLILLAYGAASYTAVDRFPLIANTPKQFYEELIQSITERIQNSDTSTLQTIIEQFNFSVIPDRDRGSRNHRSWIPASAGMTIMVNTDVRKPVNQKIQYLCREDFSFADIPDHSIDLVVSNAAFEHFDNVADAIKRVTRVVKPAARLVADIDLQTHSRILRSLDPLNIYRFNDRWYTLCKFTGSPNRVRPNEYKKALEENGWKDITVTPRITLEEQTLSQVLPFLAPRFSNAQAQMQYLDIVVSATYATIPSL